MNKINFITSPLPEHEYTLKLSLEKDYIGNVSVVAKNEKGDKITLVVFTASGALIRREREDYESFGFSTNPSNQIATL